MSWVNVQKNISFTPLLSTREKETYITQSNSFELFLFAGILNACLPHISFQPFSVLAIAGLCLAWRFAFIFKLLPATPKILQLLIAAAALGIILHGEHYNLGRDSGISLLVAALTIKQIQHQDDLNFYFSVCLTVFVAAAAFLYDQSLLAFLCVGHAVVFVALALYSKTYSNMYNKKSVSENHTNYRTVARLLFYATPLTLLLFFLTPDFNGPLWELPSDAYEAQTGLSDKMSPGKISSLVDSNDVVFRARFRYMPENKASFINSLYWRGPVFADFDGQTWQSYNQTLSKPILGKAALSDGLSKSSNDAFIKTSLYENWSQATAVTAVMQPAMRSGYQNEYHVTLEPHYANWLFTLNTPDKVQDEFYLTEDGELISRYIVNQPLQYSLAINTTVSGYGSPPDRRYLRTPNLYGFKTKRLVKQLQQELDSHTPYDIQFVSKVLAYFNEQPFYYSKQPPLAEYDPVDEFLFKTQTGFCEHYASAFTFMMRAAGIPSRVVTGYLGGEYNPVGDYIMVRQSNAHAWAEVWLQDIGWVRVDPTAVIPDHRVDKGNNDNPYLLAGFAHWDNDSFSHMAAWLDNLSFHWYEFLAKALQTRNQDWLSWVLNNKNYPLMLLLLILSSLLGWRISQRGITTADPVLRVYESFCHKLHRRGFERLPYESASAYATRVCTIRPELAQSIKPITQLYNQLRYGKYPSPAAYKQLCHQIARFRP